MDQENQANVDLHAEARSKSYRVTEAFAITPTRGPKQTYAIDATVTGAELGAFLPDVLGCLEPIA